MKKIKAVIAATAVGLALSACSVQGTPVYPDDDTITADVEVWRNDARPAMQKVSEDLNVVEAAAYTESVSLVSKACASWSESLSAAYKWYVTPRGAASVELRAGLDDWKAAAAECSTVGADYDKAARLIESGTEHISNVKSLLDGIPKATR